MMLRLELHITWHHKCCKGSTIRLGTMIERYCHPSTCVTADGSTRSSQAADLWSCGVLLSMFAYVFPCEAKLFWIFQSATELICWFVKGRKHWPKILGPNDFETPQILHRDTKNIQERIQQVTCNVYNLSRSWDNYSNVRLQVFFGADIAKTS